MLTPDQLKQALHAKGLSKTDAALICLGAGGGQAVPIARIKSVAIAAGMRGAKSINFGAHLHSAVGRAFKTPAGWELTEVGKQHVAQIVAVHLSLSPAATEAKTLRALLTTISDVETKDFLQEAIVCAESSLFRAAIVLSWVGAMALLQQRVVDKHLPAFNAEAAKRDAKWKAARTTDDLGRMKEYDFLQVIEAISVIGKNVKQELETALKLRNGCGHPNSLRVGPNKVAAHIELLAQNVFAPFGT